MIFIVSQFSDYLHVYHYIQYIHWTYSVYSLHVASSAQVRGVRGDSYTSQCPATAATPYTEGVAARERGHEVSGHRDIDVDTLDSHAVPGLSIDTYLQFTPNISPCFHSFIHILTPPHAQLPDYHHRIPSPC